MDEAFEIEGQREGDAPVRWLVEGWGSERPPLFDAAGFDVSEREAHGAELYELTRMSEDGRRTNAERCWALWFPALGRGAVRWGGDAWWSEANSVRQLARLWAFGDEYAEGR